MSFYRTYRPTVIDEVDNTEIKKRLHELLSKQPAELPHAYLLTGPKGTGKTTSARIIAKLFVCTNRTKHGPCGTCDQCTSVTAGKNIDVLEMDAASNRGIEEIRQLKAGIALAPIAAAYKVYIIDEVHMLTTDAFNALLKTLEEPPAHAVFILATTDPQKVLPTIKSRCMELSFAKAQPDELRSALARIIISEHLTVDDEAIERIIELSDGAYRDAVKMLEQMSLVSKPITRALVDETLSVPTQSLRNELFVALSQKDIGKALQSVSTLVETGLDVRVFVSDCASYVHSLLLARYLPGKSSKNHTDQFSTEELTALADLFTNVYSLLRISPIASLPLEVALVNYCGVKSEGVKKSVPQEEKKDQKPAEEKKKPEPKQTVPDARPVSTDPPPNSVELTLEKLKTHWSDVIEAMKPFNNSVSGVLRSTRPVSTDNGMIVIEAFYPFHKDRLSDAKVRDTLSSVFKKLFGVTVGIQIILGKK